MTVTSPAHHRKSTAIDGVLTITLAALISSQLAQMPPDQRPKCSPFETAVIGFDVAKRELTIECWELSGVTKPSR
jgi:hypothetical protein